MSNMSVFQGGGDDSSVPGSFTANTTLYGFEIDIAKIRSETPGDVPAATDTIFLAPLPQGLVVLGASIEWTELPSASLAEQTLTTEFSSFIQPATADSGAGPLFRRYNATIDPTGTMPQVDADAIPITFRSFPPEDRILEFKLDFLDTEIVLDGICVVSITGMFMHGRATKTKGGGILPS